MLVTRKERKKSNKVEKTLKKVKEVIIKERENKKSMKKSEIMKSGKERKPEEKKYIKQGSRTKQRKRIKIL